MKMNTKSVQKGRVDFKPWSFVLRSERLEKEKSQYSKTLLKYLYLKYLENRKVKVEKSRKIWWMTLGIKFVF